MKAFCVFLSFLSAVLFAREMPLKIKAFDIKKCSQRVIASLQLSNDTVWEIFIEPENQLLLNTVREEFEVGSPVMLMVRKDNPTLFIGKPESCKSFRSGLVVESKKNIPKFVGVKQVVIEPGGWFSDPKYAYKLYLSDGSVWKRDYLGNVKFWNKDDMIFVSHQYEDGDFSLINLDASDKSRFESGKIYDIRMSYWFSDHSSN